MIVYSLYLSKGYTHALLIDSMGNYELDWTCNLYKSVSCNSTVLPLYVGLEENKQEVKRLKIFSNPAKLLCVELSVTLCLNSYFKQWKSQTTDNTMAAQSFTEEG